MSGESLLLRRIPPEEARARARPAVDADTLARAARIVADVEARGASAVREHAERLGDLAPGAPLFITRAELEAALSRLPAEERALLERTAARIRAFAEAQRETLRPLELAIPGGRAGHAILPVERAGCYAPGGLHPLQLQVAAAAVDAFGPKHQSALRGLRPRVRGRPPLS